MTENAVRKIVREELIKIEKEKSDGLISPKEDDRGKREIQQDKSKKNKKT